MRYPVMESILVAVLLSAMSLHAQTKPDFAGKWIAVPDKTRSGGSGGCPPGARGLGEEFTLSHTPAVLAIKRMAGPIQAQTLATFTYKLDGSESRNEVSGGEAISKASWNGQQLAIDTTTVFDTGGGDVATVTMKTTQVLSLDSTGLLNVLTTLSCRDNAPATTTMVYRKGS